MIILPPLPVLRFVVPFTDLVDGGSSRAHCRLAKLGRCPSVDLVAMAGLALSPGSDPTSVAGQGGIIAIEVDVMGY